MSRLRSRAISSSHGASSPSSHGASSPWSRATFGALLALCACSCAAAQGAESLAQKREQREKEIASKSEAERARLERSFKAFRTLSEADQEKLRRLDRELKEDARTGQGQLQEAMNRYYDWLLTITPGQAADLRGETNPDKREKMVRELIKEQQDHAVAAGSMQGGRFPAGLSDEDLKAVLKVMEEAMRENSLSHEEMQQLDRKKKLAREDPKKKLAEEVYLMELAYPLRHFGQIPNWCTEEVYERMVLNISNEKQAAHIRRVGTQKEGLFWLNGLIWRNIGGKYEKLKPDQAELDRFFAGLSSAEKDQIMRLTWEQQPRQLTYMYLEKKSKEEPETYPPPPPWMRVGFQGGRGGFGPRGGGEPSRQGNVPGRGNKKRGRGQREENE